MIEEHTSNEKPVQICYTYIVITSIGGIPGENNHASQLIWLKSLG